MFVRFYVESFGVGAYSVVFRSKVRSSREIDRVRAHHVSLHDTDECCMCPPSQAW